MTAIPAREAYRLWAPTYERETAVTFLEDLLVREWGAPTSGLAVLDAGCGTGRRLRGVEAALAVGVDVTPEMLARSDGRQLLAAADIRIVPFADDTFDVVWCRLVIGHLANIAPAYAELSRVCRPGGSLVVTDFHPDAVAAGHRRTFRDSAGTVRDVEHYVHDAQAHSAAARHVHLQPTARHEGCVDPTIRAFYDDAGKLATYEAQLGLRLVIVHCYRKT
jgi:malonyl-CoA O-methyltransferase